MRSPHRNPGRGAAQVLLILDQQDGCGDHEIAIDNQIEAGALSKKAMKSACSAGAPSKPRPCAIAPRLQPFQKADQPVRDRVGVFLLDPVSGVDHVRAAQVRHHRFHDVGAARKLA